jgi:hypothetical protein
MNVQANCFALLVLIGMTQSTHIASYHNFAQCCFVSVKDKLKSGEMVVAGDQWPVFLYESYRYDPEAPWTGLLRSSLLVTAHILNMNVCRSSQLTFTRLSSISSHHQVQFIRNLVPPALVTLAFTE